MVSFIRAWLRKNEGATAVEFALVAVPFVFLIIGTIEIALVFTVQSVLQESTFTASRMIRTGQIQQGAAGDPETAFRESVCDFAAILIPCGEIEFQVEALPSFSEAQDRPPEFDGDGNLLNTGFDPGGASDVVLVRVAYNYPIRTPLMRPVLSNLGGGKRAMLATTIFRTEPYE
ncbi:MAG: TadE/TadG family type IV pilus assembly protein [Micavibrio sp.]